MRFYKTPDKRVIINPFIFSASAVDYSTPPITAALQLNLDASDASTLFDATTGGSASTSGGVVRRWEDKSGNGRHATAASNSPTRSVAAINSRDALAWGTAKTMAIPSQNLSVSWGISDFTVFCVVQTGGAGTNRPMYNWFAGSGSNYFGLWALYTDNKFYLDHGNTGSGGRISATGTSTTATQVVTSRKSGTSGEVRRDGVSVLSGTLSSSLISASGTFEIGYNNTPSLAMTGLYCQILVYSSALSPTDRAAVEAWLKAKWGTP